MDESIPSDKMTKEERTETIKHFLFVVMPILVAMFCIITTNISNCIK